MRRLIVNADDFGFTRDVNAGIVRAHREGIVTAATLMAVGEAFEDALRLMEQTPTLDVGCHVTLVGGLRAAATGQPLPRTVSQLAWALARGRLDARVEMRAQLERLRKAGVRATHLDTHKHTHLLLGVLEALGEVAREYGVRYVRRPIDLPWGMLPDESGWARRVVSAVTGALRPAFDARLRKHGCKTTDHFAGFRITGRFDAGTLAEALRRLPDGLTELMCHPGYCGAELRAAATRLKESRERELEALVAPLVKEAVKEAGIRLTSYRELEAEQEGSAAAGGR